jgi:hypothetical protein
MSHLELKVDQSIEVLNNIQRLLVEALNSDESVAIIQQLFVARNSAQAQLIRDQDKLIKSLSKGA